MILSQNGAACGKYIPTTEADHGATFALQKLKAPALTPLFLLLLALLPPPPTLSNTLLTFRFYLRRNTQVYTCGCVP